MTLHIKATDTGPFASIYDINGNALTATGPDSLIVDANAFLISQINGYGADLTGSWKVNVNGTVGSLDLTHSGMRITGAPADRTTVTIGRTGELFGRGAGLDFEQAGKIINKGIISGFNNGIFISSNATDATLVNSGVIKGDLFGVQFLVTVSRLLAEIPDIAVLILRIAIASPLHQLAIHKGAVEDDDAVDAEQRLRLVRDGRSHGLRSIGTLVDKRCPGFQRKIAIVDLMDEICGIECGHARFPPPAASARRGRSNDAPQATQT